MYEQFFPGSEIPLDEAWKKSTLPAVESISANLDIEFLPNDQDKIRQAYLHSVRALDGVETIPELEFNRKWVTIKGQETAELSGQPPEFVHSNESSGLPLAEVGAANCSLFLLFDDSGRAYSWHTSSTSHADLNRRTIPLIQEFLKNNEKLNGHTHLILTGLNVNTSRRETLAKVVKQEADSIAADLIPLFSKFQAESGEEEFEEAISVYRIVGMLFLPAAWSITGKNKVFVLTQTRET